MDEVRCGVKGVGAAMGVGAVTGLGGVMEEGKARREQGG